MEDLNQRIRKLKLNLNLASKEDFEDERFGLINTPDSELTAD